MLSHLAGTGRFPREAENSGPGSEQGDGTCWPGVAGGRGGGRNPHPLQLLPWVMPWPLHNPMLAAHFRLAGSRRGRRSFKIISSLQFPTPGLLDLEKQTSRGQRPHLDSQTLSSSSGSHGKRNEQRRTSKAMCTFNQSLAPGMF